ncbi:MULTISPECIES: SMP-30/gluconolactonase/LRE family protein [unclassified Pantoea]|uniref:SMP-30/gluconolactonase/LRE family protein n=1 Tax=unclassified Pantoea TaxID=2630326 RepID=UPI001CD564C7|nr:MULTISPECIES: L-dopachrome tautomerase-related protein [unclassified Pantoea]MCA1179344.1 glyoxalase [Pantoea sp. alder69]MCA1252547.1 glyoxalase [Pantoea sp. alder70]MCA1268130.1 glyoxalase [Pantoea sp. alder81]
MQRREFIAGGLATLCLPRAAFAVAESMINPQLQVAATSPWLANGIAVSAGGAMFLNFPRFKGHEKSPALARVTESGLAPFPGNHWNEWTPGDEGLNSLVNVNACHHFGDGLLWAVDQGAPQGEQPSKGAAKLVAFNIATGEAASVIRFDEKALPPGGAPNDLRIQGNSVYVTDSGLGGVIIHDLETGKTIRRLSGNALLRKPEGLVQKGYQGRILEDNRGKRPAVHSDVIEVSPDGQWLYYAPPTGPLYRIPTASLKDQRLSDKALAGQVEKVADIPSIGGSAIDAAGNIYLSNVEIRSVDKLQPDGTLKTLIQDERLITPDALVISGGWIYVPVPQIEYLADNNPGKDATHGPWSVYRFSLST